MKSPIALLALVISLLAAGYSYWRTAKVRSFAFMDTQRAMAGFKPAIEANQKVKEEDERWKKNLKIMEDSLKSYMDTMTVRYDRGTVQEKKAMQDELAMRNQQINNYTAVQGRKMQEFATQQLSGVYEKLNGFMREYGKAKGYDVVFGTANGSILYGEGTAADITDEVLKALNKRYE
jgi:outer membrane protein